MKTFITVIKSVIHIVYNGVTLNAVTVGCLKRFHYNLNHSWVPSGAHEYKERVTSREQISVFNHVGVNHNSELGHSTRNFCGKLPYKE